MFGKNSKKFSEKIRVIPELKFFMEHNHIQFVHHHLTPHFNSSTVGLNEPAMGALYFNNYVPKFFQLLLMTYQKFSSILHEIRQNLAQNSHKFAIRIMETQ